MPLRVSSGVFGWLLLPLALLLPSANSLAATHPDAAKAEAVHAADQTAQVTLHEGTNIALALSPDHDHIIIDLQGDLFKLAADGGDATRLNMPVKARALPDWSPDGRRVVFQAFVDNNFNIMSMRPDGSDVRKLTQGHADNREPRFSPDGSRIAFSSDRDGSYDIWVLDRDSGELTQWTDNPVEEFQPTWSPDGERIAYVVGRKGPETGGEFKARAIKVTDAKGNTETLVDDAGGRVFSPSWSPDGSQLAYTVLLDGTHEMRLYISGQPVSGADEDVFPFPAEWVSGSEVLYTADGRIKRRDLTTGGVHTVPFTAQVTIAQAQHESKPYAFGHEREPEQVDGILWPVISPDGSKVAFVALNDLWVMDIGEKPRRITHDLYTELHPTWSPDGQYLAYSSDRGGIEKVYIRNMATGDERRLTNFAGGPLVANNQYRATWCPDGDKIAFQTGSGYTKTVTWVADVSTGKVSKAFGVLFEPGAPTWGPGCDTLALAAVNVINDRYRQGYNEIRTVDLETGDTAWIDPEPFKNLSGRASGNGPVWSPDGNYMAFVRGSVLWTMPVGPDGQPTGKPQPITEEVADYISWTGDSESLLYLSNGELRMVSRDGGEPRTVALDLSWQPKVPEGRTIIHAGAVWDGISPWLRRNVDIVIDGNRIAGIRPHQPKDSYPDDVQYVDAGNLTVMPGLFESHIHREWVPFLGAREGRQLLAYGITSTIAMGDPVYRSLETEEAVLSGALVGPRAFTGAEHINGARIYYGWMRPTANETMLERELDRIEALDADILKTYVRLPNAFQAQAIKAAHDMGIPAYSHYFYPSLAFGQDGMSHVSATQRLGFSRTESFGGHIYNDVRKLASQSGMTITTTPFSNTLLVEHPEVLFDARIETLYAPGQTKKLRDAFEAVVSSPQADAREEIKRVQTTLAGIQEAGGTILAGTDQPLMHVGFSLHQTLRIMVRFGNFSPYEALQAATIAPARHMGVGDELGSIESGKIADLIFIKGNPLQDISDVANVRMVMRGGHLHTLEALLEPFVQKPGASDM